MIYLALWFCSHCCVLMVYKPNKILLFYVMFIIVVFCINWVYYEILFCCFIMNFPFCISHLMRYLLTFYCPI